MKHKIRVGHGKGVTCQTLKTWLNENLVQSEISKCNKIGECSKNLQPLIFALQSVCPNTFSQPLLSKRPQREVQGT